jgi:hypothetical protein
MTAILFGADQIGLADDVRDAVVSLLDPIDV